MPSTLAQSRTLTARRATWHVRACPCALTSVSLAGNPRNSLSRRNTRHPHRGPHPLDLLFAHGLSHPVRRHERTIHIPTVLQFPEVDENPALNLRRVPWPLKPTRRWPLCTRKLFPVVWPAASRLCLNPSCQDLCSHDPRVQISLRFKQLICSAHCGYDKSSDNYNCRCTGHNGGRNDPSPKSGRSLHLDITRRCLRRSREAVASLRELTRPSIGEP